MQVDSPTHFFSFLDFNSSSIAPVDVVNDGQYILVCIRNFKIVIGLTRRKKALEMNIYPWFEKYYKFFNKR